MAVGARLWATAAWIALSAACTTDHDEQLDVARITAAASVSVSATEICGIDVDCEGPGVEEGHGLVSGVPRVDAVLQAGIEVHRDVAALTASLRHQLDALHVLFDVPAGADPAATLSARFADETVDGVVAESEPVRCWSGADTARRFALRCDPDATGPVTTACETGTCECDPFTNCVAAPDECTGRCDGAVKVDGVAAPCDALATAQSSIGAICSPPPLTLHYEPAAAQGADALAATM